MFGLAYVALRYFNVYGPRMDIHGRYTEVLVRWMDRIASGQPPLILGDGKQTMDFIFIDDVARSNILALRSDVSDEVFNVASGTETSLRQLADALSRVMDAESDFAQIELRALATAHRFDDRVVPHSASVEIPGGDEERRARIVSPQQRQRDPIVVGVAVVERYRRCSLRQCSTGEKRHGAIERQYVEPRRHPAEDPVERRRVGNIGH